MEKFKIFLFVGLGMFSVVFAGGKYIEPIKYNDAVVMAHILGSGALNLFYYFHLLGIDCENKDQEYYAFADKEFKLCTNRTGHLPLGIRSKPYGSVLKACEMWRHHKDCYSVYKDDLDDCSVNKLSEKKAIDGFRFTEAYARYICRDPEDTELHLIDRFTRRDIIAPGAFTCFPNLQDRIINCIKNDPYAGSTSTCSNLYTVRECFASFYDEKYCDDDDTILFMDDMFTSLSKSLKCPLEEDDWLNKLDPVTTSPYGRPKSTTNGYGPGWKTTSTTYGYGKSNTQSISTYGRSGVRSSKAKTINHNYGSGFPYY